MIPLVKSMARHVWFFAVGSLFALGLSQLSFGWENNCYGDNNQCSDIGGCNDKGLGGPYINGNDLKSSGGHRVSGTFCGQKNGPTGQIHGCGRFVQGSTC
jgi:hypothetical protein